MAATPLAAIEQLFHGMRTADPATVRAVLAADARFAQLDSGGGTPDEVVVQAKSMDDWVEAIGNSGGSWNEQIYSVSIRTDDGMASAWAPYTFYRDGAISHCGVNSIELLRERPGGWKITQLSDTRRHGTSCPDPLGDTMAPVLSEAAEAAVATIEAQVSADVAEDGIGGISLGIVGPGGRLLRWRAFGWARKGYGGAEWLPNRDADKIFRIGSISKSVTVVGLMSLVEDGVLSLDDMAENLVPEVKEIVGYADHEPFTLQVLRKHLFGRHFILKMDHFTKTNSGQTQGSTQKRRTVSRSRCSRLTPPASIASPTHWSRRWLA
jgi:hypothetical protein